MLRKDKDKSTIPTKPTTKTKTTRLIEFLNNHEPLAALMDLNLQSPENTEQIKEHALQIAINDGRIDVVAWLINNNVNLPAEINISINDRPDIAQPLLNQEIAESKYPEELHKHYPLMAQFLACCNAYPKQYFDAEIAAAIFVRALRKKEDTLINLILANIPNDSAFIELALQCKKIEIAEKLLAKLAPNLRSEPEILTAAFWAAQCDIQLLDKMYLSTDHLLLTLKQSENKKEIYNAISIKIGPMSNLRGEHSKHISKCIEAKTIVFTPKQHIAKEFAAAAQVNLLKQSQLSLEDFTVLFNYAYSKQNYVAMNAILEATPKHIELFLSLIKDHQYESARFLVIAADLDVYELAFACRHSAHLLKKMIELIWDAEGLLTNLIKRSIKQDTKPSQEVSELIANLSHFNIVSEGLRKQIFEQQIELSYADEFKQDQILLQPQDTLFDKFIDTLVRLNQDRIHKRELKKQEIEHKKQQLQFKQKNLIASLANRVYLSHDSEVAEDLSIAYEPLPGSLLSLIIDYLELEDQENIKNISQTYWERVAKLNPNAPWVAKGKIKQLVNQIQALEKFLTLFEEEKNKWLAFDFYKDTKKCAIPGMVLLIPAMIVCFYFLGTSTQRLNNDPSCREGSDCFHENGSNQFFGIFFGTLSSAAFLGVVGHLIFFKYYSPHRTMQQLNDSIFFTFSTPCNRAINQVFEEFSCLAANPFADKTITRSKVREIVDIAQTTLDLKKAELESLIRKPDPSLQNNYGRFFAMEAADTKQDADCKQEDHKVTLSL